MNLTTCYLALLAAILAVAAGRTLALSLPVMELPEDEFPQIQEQNLENQNMRDLVMTRLMSIMHRLKNDHAVDLQEELETLDQGAEKMLGDDFNKRGRRPARKICINDIWKGRGGGLRCN